jgi:molybdopterin molybdotransferase
LGIARDEINDPAEKIRAGLDQNVDLFLTSGGVSVGDFDVIKQVLAAEGNMSFWRVRMKPGKPFAFGQIEGVPLLGLPGNPVSAMISFEMFARPAMCKMLGIEKWKRPMVEATLIDEIPSKDDRRHYVRVRIEKVPRSASSAAGTYRAYLTGSQGSGILSSMVLANGLAIISEDASSMAAGTSVPVMMLDWE